MTGPGNGALGLRARLARKADALGRELFLERGHDPGRAALVLGSGRSGTTWLGEALARQSGSRFMFEPFHPRWCAAGGGLRLFLDPAEAGGAMKATVDGVLSGRLRDRHWVDQITMARLPRGRVVKDIHTGNLLPWFRARYPRLPVVFAVRHPIATALSRRRVDSFQGLGAYLDTAAGRADAERSPVAAWLPVYDGYREHPDSLVRFVAEWCIENAYPLSVLDDGPVALSFYETAVQDPVTELTRLAEFCSGALGPVDRSRLTAEAVRRPSAKDFFDTAAAAQGTGEWSRVATRWTAEVSAATTKSCIEVLEEFGVAGFYGEGPMPLRQG